MSLAAGALLDRLCAYLGVDETGFPDAYQRLRRKLIKYFNWNGCWEAAQLADETLVRVVTAVNRDAAINDFMNFVFGVARNVLADWRKGAWRTESLEPLFNLGIEPESPRPESSDAAICLEKCLAALPPTQREFIEACFVDKQRASAASNLGISANAVRIRLFNAKRGLRRCIAHCVETGRIRP